MGHIDGAFEHAAIGMALVAPDGRWLRVNRALCGIMGYSEQELLATTFQAITHPEDLTADLAFVRRMLAGDIETYQMEKRYLQRQGAVIWVLLSVSLVRDDAGAPRYFISQLQDITQRKRGELELLRQALVFDTISDGVIVMDMGGRVTDWNPAAERIFGYTKDEMLGRAVERIHHPRLGGALERDIQGRLAREGRWSGELPFVTKDGAEGIADVVVVVQRDAIGAPAAWIGVNRDATERKRAEEAIRRSEASFRSFVENAPYGIYRSTTGGEFLAVNPAFVAMLGYESEAELLAVNNIAARVYEDPAVRARLMAQSLQDGFVKPVEVGWKRKDGTLIAVRLSARAEHDAGGAVLYWEGFAEDVTALRTAEEALRQNDERLRVAARLEAVGQLAGGVAHDFNNLLTAITSYTALLLDDLDDSDPMRADLCQIKGAADRATALTRQLLAFSRRQMLQPRVLDLNTTVADMDNMFRRLIAEDIELVAVLDPALGRVSADPGQIEQVLMNLVVNARDAMPEGGRLIIETANVEVDEESAVRHSPILVRPGSYVRLAVSDVGCGMDVATQARIFEPFFTTKGPGKGTGLGLSTVYGIVKQSGGYVWCYSEPARGTTFKVYLPRVEATVDQPGDAPTRLAVGRGSGTILLVEDDEAVRTVARRILAKQGYTVLEAENGVEALRICAETTVPLDLILTDMVMPEVGGPELARQVRARHPEIRLLFMSGYTEDAALRQGFLDSGATFIEKPFVPSVLAQRIRDALDLPSPAGAHRRLES